MTSKLIKQRIQDIFNTGVSVEAIAEYFDLSEILVKSILNLKMK